MAKTREQIVAAIAELEGRIKTKEGEISERNIAIGERKAEIAELRKLLVEAEEPFEGTTLALRLGNNNLPTLGGVNQAAAKLINDIGARPAGVIIDGVTVNVSGRDSVTLSIAGEDDPVVAAGKLAKFADDHSITVNLDQVKKLKNDNVSRAVQFTDVAELQLSIIEKFPDKSDTGGTPTIVAPVLGTPVVEINGRDVEVTFTATGDAPITYTMKWEGDGDTAVPVTSPAEHTYTMAGTYDAVLTATNTGGSDSKVVQIEVV